MLFNSFTYAVFLPIVFAAFWLIPKRFRWVVIFAASYYFYMSWNASYVVLILGTTLISYLAGLILDRTEKPGVRKFWLTLTLVVCFGVLFLFKYFNFFADNVVAALTLMGFHPHPVTLNLLLPVGISFYTFQTLSYVIDVYRGDVKAQRHFGIYASFVSFFPQLVAGPIERTENLLPQIDKDHKLDYKRSSDGLKLMAWGFFKKIIVADTLASFVDKVYGDVYSYTGFALVAASAMFAVQIYCDFSGYSDIAIGTGKLFDIDLMTNFSAPYFSRSIREFWSRWHISLSTWFRDYVYIPLGGNRRGKARTRFNLLVTFLVSGMWHGASWQFIIWGALHGVGQVLENLLPRKKAEKKDPGHFGLKDWLKVLFVFCFVTAAWVFFRAADLQSTAWIFANAFRGIGNPVSYVYRGLASMGIFMEEAIDLIIMLGVLAVYDYFSLRTNVISRISGLKPLARWSIYIGFSLLILFLLPSVSGGEFIYFQF